MLSIFLVQSNRIGGNQVSVLSKPISLKVPVSMALGAVDDLKKVVRSPALVVAFFNRKISCRAQYSPIIPVFGT